MTVKSFEKRNASFFDRLKERLMGSTNAGSSQVAVSNREDLKCWCTFEAISLEELAKHKQTHHTALSVSSSITRCPNCRRHCKNLTDLELHMKFCSSMSNNLMISNSSQENTVISTNYTATSNCDDFEFPLQVDWEGSVGGLNSSGSSVRGLFFFYFMILPFFIYVSFFIYLNICLFIIFFTLMFSTSRAKE